MFSNNINSRSDHNVKTYKALQIGNIDIYLCPKCGTNSARYASYKFNNGELEVPNIRDLTSLDYDVLKMGPSSVLNYKEERSDSIKVAIKRDPVKRFVSSLAWYNYKYGDIKKTVEKETIDLALLKTPDDIHFFPQSAFYGDDISKYDHVIYPSELRNLILEITSVDLGPLHKGQTTLEYEVPTEKQITMIKKLYQMDYENGYY